MDESFNLDYGLVAPAATSSDRSGVSKLPAVDAELRERILALSSDDPEFWTFSRLAQRDHAHGYHQYPAMMVPAMQRALIDAVLQSQPAIRSCVDPFAGSGTVLTEAMHLGLDVRVQDINPLAVLSCVTKAGPYRPEDLSIRLADLGARLADDNTTCREACFAGLEKWFRNDAIIMLSRIQRAVRAERDVWVRRFCWLAVAETVRLTSNSRPTNFKLHLRAEADIPNIPSPSDTFFTILNRNFMRYTSFASTLTQAGQLDASGAYRGKIECLLRDSRAPLGGKFDLLVTSPPYGDNTSTVPYGQSSYLPLQWIDLPDIPGEATENSLVSTYEIDRRSLGGAKARGDLMALSEDLRSRSMSFHLTMQALASAPRDRANRVFAFVRDLDKSLDEITAALSPNAYMVWTLGNRGVGGIRIPLDEITRELLEARRMIHVHTIQRRIPSKRMAVRNSYATTMRAEHILIARKPEALTP